MVNHSRQRRVRDQKLDDDEVVYAQFFITYTTCHGPATEMSSMVVLNDMAVVYRNDLDTPRGMHTCWTNTVVVEDHGVYVVDGAGVDDVVVQSTVGWLVGL